MTATLAELVQTVGGTLCGMVDATTPERRVNGVAPLTDATADDLAWFADRKYARALTLTQAAAVLMPADVEPPAGITGIQVDDPDLALIAALELLAPPAYTVPPGVHPTAVVADDAEIAGAAIGPHAVVGPGARVGAGTQVHAGVTIGPAATAGRDCVLWPGVVLRERVTLGDRVIVHPNAVIGADGFGYLQRDGRHVKIPQIGTVVIEADVEIGANTTIDRARSGETRIGAGSKIDNLVQIGHNVRIGAGCVIVAQVGVSGSCEFGRYVVLAGQAGVADHVKIGDGAIVGARSAVMRDVPAGKVFVGTPAEEARAHQRQTVLVRRLPDFQEELRALRKRVEQLESSADD